MKILVTGGTGFLGTDLADELIRQGHDLIMSTRGLSPQWDPYPAQFVKWPLDREELAPHLGDIEACIHLVGESVASQRWSDKQKQKIKFSRVAGTQEVVDMLRLCPRLKVFISASATGIYGNRGEEELTEQSSDGQGFLAEVCQAWEAEAKKLDRPDVRAALIRTGVVFGRGSGFLDQMETLFKNQLGGVIGSGEQFISWIHQQDWVNAVMFTLNNAYLSGPVNLTAPQPVTNKNFTYSYGELLGQLLYPPVPKFAAKLAMGEMSCLATDSQYVVPQKLLKQDFKFQYPNLSDALNDIYDISDLYNKVDDCFMARQYLPYPAEEVFKFFSDEKNLEKITPPFMGFHVIGKSTEQIGEGTLINYKLKIHSVPANWQTLIEKWKPPHMFIDTQLKGPYKRWHHTHSFESFGKGTLMKDKVHYRLPMGWLGRTSALWLVKSDIQKIFSYRRTVIGDLFPA